MGSYLARMRGGVRAVAVEILAWLMWVLAMLEDWWMWVAAAGIGIVGAGVAFWWWTKGKRE